MNEPTEYTEAWDEPELTPEEREAKAAAAKQAALAEEASAAPAADTLATNEGEPPLVNAVQAAHDAGLKDEQMQYEEAYAGNTMGATD